MLSRIFQVGNTLVSFYGPTLNTTDLRRFAADEIPSCNPERICCIKAPSNAECTGFGQIVSQPNFVQIGTAPNEYAEGAILNQPGDTIIMRSADCPFVILDEKTERRSVCVHAGRSALTPVFVDGEMTNIIAKAYSLITEGVAEPNVSAYITGSICGKHFLHDRPDAWQFVEPFFKYFGESVFYDIELGALDMSTIITMQLLDLGTPDNQITHDDQCTYEFPRFASYRRASTKPLNDEDTPDKRNAVIVTRQQRQ